jgi:Flp pilus assembly protein TadD
VARSRQRLAVARRARRQPSARGPLSSWWPIAFLFACALIVRLIYIHDVWRSPFAAALIGDGREYDAWAQRIAAGDWVGTDVFYQAPLYPYTLAVIFRVAGHDLFVVRVVQAVWSAAACVLVACAGARVFDRTIGLIAGSLMAVYAPSIFFDGLIQKSSLDFLLIAVSLYALGEWRIRQRGWPIAVAAAALGLLALNRENARVLIPVVGAWLMLRREWRGTLIFTLTLVVVLTPVAARNYAVGGEFFLSTSQAGPNFYIGNHSGATGLYEPLLPNRGSAKYEREDAARLAEQASGRSLSPGEVSRYWTARALADVSAHPLSWLRLMTRKTLLTLNHAEASDTESLAAYAEQSSILRALAWINFGVLLPLAVWGAWLERDRWRDLGILYAVVIALLGSVIVFFVFDRYRFPVAPALALFAAVPLARAASMSWSVRRQWLPGAALAGLTAACAWWPLTMNADETYLNVGRQLTADGHARDAIPLLELSASRNPTDPADAFALAVALDRADDKARALEWFRRAVTLDPQSGRAQGALALALTDAGLASEAMDHFAASVRVSPSDAAVRTNYGIALLQGGRAPEAVDQLREAARLAPTNTTARTALGSALASTGHGDDAVDQFRAVVQADPRNARAHANLALALHGIGRTAEAAREMAEAVKLDPALAETAAMRR